MNKSKKEKSLFSIILLIFFFICYKEIKCEFCTVDDYKIKLFKYDRGTQTRNITFYLSSKCIIPKNITKNDPIYPYYTLPIYKVSCINCFQNEIIVYESNKKDIICQKCPKNTYSNGNSLIFFKNWSEDIINKYFTIKCISNDEFGNKNNKNCTKLKINKNYIELENILSDNKNYTIRIIMTFKSENFGKLILSYKKDTFFVNKKYNGVLKIFFEKELIKVDSK